MSGVSNRSPLEGIAIRANKLLKGPLPYIDAFIKAMPDLWSPSNRDGWVPLVVAENKLGNDIMLQRMNQITSFPSWIMNYGHMKGSTTLRKSFASLMNRTFVPEPTLDPENMCILSGCTPIIESLFYCIADSCSSVLIPTPYYPAFDNDLQAKNDLIPVPFVLDESLPISPQLDGLMQSASEKNQPVAALLITNPNNPLGIIYKEDTVVEMMAWCLRNNIHYVSDEIYALSIYDKETTFVSAITLAQHAFHDEFSQNLIDRYIHLVYGLSKDWCASGLRVGVVYTRNHPLQQALNCLAPFACISNHTQHALSEVLNDVEWTESFIVENKNLLSNSYDLLTKELDAACIPYVPAMAGMFVWIDLRQYLQEKTWDGEALLWEKLCYEAKVILTPGSSCHATEPGYFRLCFAWVVPDALIDAVQRIKEHAA